MGDDEFLSELREQLLDAAARRDHVPHRRTGRRLVVLGGVAAALVAVLVGLLVVRNEDPAAADVDVIVDGNDLIVRLNDLETRPEEIVAAAKHAGLDVRIREVPVGPSNVGRFIGSTASVPADFRPIDERLHAFTGFRISRDWTGTLELAIGREARPGEQWFGVSDALAPGEALECEPLLGESVGAVESSLRGRDLHVRWFMIPSPGEVHRLGGYRSWRVVQVQATGPQDIMVMATEDGSWPVEGERPRFPDDC